ncbi:MAG: ATP-binding protein [Treponema sp.]|nr:ATP-binding protein [Treponema sp.]
MDIAQNGAESGASLIELHVAGSECLKEKGELSFTVKDNGKGMTEEELKNAGNPFVNNGKKHPHRKAGFGLPFFIQTAEVSGGEWKIKSTGKGTTITGSFNCENVDTPPIGDIPGMFRTVLLFEGPGEVVISRTVNGRSYVLKKTELNDVLSDLGNSSSLILLDKYLRGMEIPHS